MRFCIKNFLTTKSFTIKFFWMALTKEQQIWRYLLDHKTNEEIRELCHTNTRRITRVRHALVNGLACPFPKTMGRPTKITSEVIQIVHDETIADPWISSRNISSAIGDAGYGLVRPWIPFAIL
jgi:hypothetical protein